MKNAKTYWRLCCAAAVLLSALALTPFVIPAGEPGPMLGGIPRTLWTGFLVTVALVALTLVGSLVHPAMNTDEDA